MTPGQWRRSFEERARAIAGLGALHDPPPRPPPPDGSSPYIYEPCLDVDPMPDYENVLTD